METTSQINNKKLLTFAVLTLFLLSAIAISLVSAQVDSTRIPDQSPTDGGSLLTAENPSLIATEDNGTTANDLPTSDRAQDKSTVPSDDNPTLYDAQNTESNDNPNLIATQSQPDYTVIAIAIVAVTAAIAGLAVIVGRRHRKN